MPPKKKPAPPAPPAFPRVVETFSDNLTHVLNGLDGSGPRVWNGVVSVRRYRVTAELIEESDDVIRERLRVLWRTSDSHHHRDPLRAAARRLGLELDTFEHGVDAKR
jgi:hypothetical protein